VEANVKQVIEGKAAPKALKTQNDAVATMGTKAKMASAAGMAMYQGSAIQGFRSGQTNEISLTTASFFYSCNIPIPPPPHNAASDGELLERLYDVAKIGVQYIPSARRRTVWLVDLFGWLGKLRIPISDERAGLPQVRRCAWSSGRWWRTKDADFIAEQALEVLEDSELLGRRLSSYKVAHCYAQTPWILRWVGLSSLLMHTHTHTLSTLAHSLSIVRSTV
jgi:hypothetical protein